MSVDSVKVYFYLLLLLNYLSHEITKKEDIIIG